MLFGTVFAINATFKWLPGYRDTFVGHTRSVAGGQPAWLHGWFQFWISAEASFPLLFAIMTAVTETSLALVLLLGVARRAGYTAGALYMLMVWGVGEGFGGPYTTGATDIGTGIVYVLLFATLLALAPPARSERLSLDRLLVARWPWWRMLAEPHRADRAGGPPVTGPVTSGLRTHVQVR